MLKFINFPAFLIGLSLGLVFVYLSAPTHNVVMVYPTPDNVNKVQYKDKAGTCFRFDPIDSECPNDESMIKNIPIQN